MTWKRGLFRLWTVISIFSVLIITLVMISVAVEKLDGDFRIRLPNFGSPPEKPETLEVKEEYVNAKVAELLGISRRELKTMGRSERDERASIALNDIQLEAPAIEVAEADQMLLDIFGEYSMLESIAGRERRDSLTPKQRELEEQYAAEIHLWEERAEFYDFVPMFFVGTIVLAASFPLFLLAIYFILAWLARGFVSVDQ